MGVSIDKTKNHTIYIYIYIFIYLCDIQAIFDLQITKQQINVIIKTQKHNQFHIYIRRVFKLDAENLRFMIN